MSDENERSLTPMESMLVSTMLTELRTELSATGMFDMSVVDDLIDKTQEHTLEGIRIPDSTEGWMTEKYNRLITQLAQGERVAVNDLQYTYPPVPVIRVASSKNMYDDIPLDCVADGGLDVYMPEKPIKNLDTVSVIGYQEPRRANIQYIYSDHNLDKVYAHLDTGEDVEYSLSIADIWKVGETFEGIPALSDSDTRSVKLSTLNGILRSCLPDNVEGAQIWEEIVRLSQLRE